MLSTQTLNDGLDVVKRQYYGYGGYYGNSNWYNWGRWVLLGAIILVFFVVFFLCSCLTARRRRNRGNTPYYGTGWLAPQHGPVNYYNNGPQMENQTYQPPNYSTRPAPTYGNGQNAGYYGQENGVELQQPSSTYQPQTGGAYVYQPPSGPPPGKRDIVA